MNTNTPRIETIQAAAAALENSGLADFAQILRDEIKNGLSPEQWAALASDVNVRIHRVQDEPAASAYLSAIVREVYQ